MSAHLNLLYLFTTCLLHYNVNFKKSHLYSQYPKHRKHSKSKIKLRCSEQPDFQFLLESFFFIDSILFFLSLISCKSCTFLRVILWDTLHIYLNRNDHSARYLLLIYSWKLTKLINAEPEFKQRSGDLKAYHFVIKSCDFLLSEYYWGPWLCSVAPTLSSHLVCFSTPYIMWLEVFLLLC
jgi:hypothetical protein